MKNRNGPVVWGQEKANSPRRRLGGWTVGILAGSLLSFSLLAAPIQAQTPAQPVSGNTCTVKNDPDTCEAIETIDQILNFMALLVLPICGIILIVAGIQYSTARNEPKVLADARLRMYKVVLAIILFVGLWSFLKWLLPGGVLE